MHDDRAAASDQQASWTVEITSYIPVLAPNDIGLKLTVISLDGNEETFDLDAKQPPKAVDRVVNEDLPGRMDTFTVSLPRHFEPAAVRVLDL